MYQQSYLPNEVIYDVGEPDCDIVYFIVKGRINVHAHVTIEQQTITPTGPSEWTKNVVSTEVHYFVKQLSEGHCFGIEELIELGLLKYGGGD